MVKIRISGPEDFKAWMECFTIFKITLVGFDQVDVGTLEAYAEHIKFYAETTPEGWGGGSLTRATKELDLRNSRGFAHTAAHGRHA